MNGDEPPEGDPVKGFMLVVGFAVGVACLIVLQAVVDLVMRR